MATLRIVDELRIAGPELEAFLRLVQMVIVPLVFSSLTVGVASLGDLRKVGRIGVPIRVTAR